MAVNSPRWSALFLCNYTVKGDIVDALMTGKNTSHYNKRIFRALVSNELETKEDRAIAARCRAEGYPADMKSAWEFRHPTLGLLKEKKNDPETFATERMMQPRSRKDQKFKDNYFRFHTRQEISLGSYIFYTYVDPSAKDAADCKAVITVGIGLRSDMPHIPVVRASIQQQPVDEMLRETYRHRQTYRSKLVGVETNGFQILLKKEYMRLQKQLGLLPFQEVEHTGESKESRVERIVPFVKEGIITFDLEDPDQIALIDQLKAFPNGGEVAKGGLGDDGPDALAGAVELIELYQHAGEVRYESVQRRLSSFRGGSY
jgi:predicted phage terminase large subunit-like protein